ncbi:MAG: acyl-CoA desaturase, partial [Luteimonas sp.]
MGSTSNPTPASGEGCQRPRSIDAARGIRGWRACLSHTVRRWIDTQEASDSTEGKASPERIDWLRAAPFVAMHLACFAVLWVGVSAVAVWVAIALYMVRMFALTAFYHRYFSHRTFRTSRTVQFAFALIGASCVQRGPLWWAAHHRSHHRNA